MPFTLTMPKLSPTMTEGTVAKWHKKIGEYCDSDELILDIGTDKATIEHHAIDPGFLRTILVKEGQKVDVGGALAYFSESADENIADFVPKQKIQKISPDVVEKTSQKTVEKEDYFSTRISASPLAKKLAKEQGISLSEVVGSGPKGRIMSRDLENAPSEETSGKETMLSPIRRVIAERLSFSKATIPHFYCSIKVDATALFSVREELKSVSQSFTINDFIIRSVAYSLMKHPTLRGTFDPKRNVASTHAHADIAVAVSVPGGLFTPILFGAENKSLAEISKEMKALSEKAKTGKLVPSEYMGGSFTISNLGMFGIDEFYPIINPPQVAILGVGAIVDAPIVRNGDLTVGKSLTLCLAADHRAMDGTDAAAFLKTLKEYLEKPTQLLVYSHLN